MAEKTPRLRPHQSQLPERRVNPYVKEYERRLGQLTLRDPVEMGWIFEADPIETPESQPADG